MEPGGISVSVCAAALHTIKDPSVEGQHRRVMVCFLVSCVCDWICKPGTEQHSRGRSAELRQCHTNEDSARLQHNTKEAKGGLSEKRRHKTSAQGCTICLETYEGTKNSLGLGYSITAGAARHCGCDFRLKSCASNGGANLNAVDTRAGRTGLNLHFILVILFSTNKLTPEKT